MDGVRKPKMNGESFLPSLKNEQLPTPALSPVLLGNATFSDDGNSLQRNDSALSRKQSVQDESATSDSSKDSRPIPRIQRPGDTRRRSSAGMVASPTSSEHGDRILKLSPAQIHELTSSPTSLPLRAASPIPEDTVPLLGPPPRLDGEQYAQGSTTSAILEESPGCNGSKAVNGERGMRSGSKTLSAKQEQEVTAVKSPVGELRVGRPGLSSRAASTPTINRRKESTQRQTREDGSGRSSRPIPPPLNLEPKESNANGSASQKPTAVPERVLPSPMPPAMPLPPMSLPTFLSLELSADRPSPLYIYRSSTSDFPYESSKVKFERLINFLWLPPQLEQVLGFGAFACLDAWLSVLTILPLRFFIALWILVQWWWAFLLKEVHSISAFIYSGLGRVWRRRRNTAQSRPRELSEDLAKPTAQSDSVSAVSQRVTSTKEKPKAVQGLSDPKQKYLRSSAYRHRRTKSTPSALLPSHKADILKGLLVIASCALLMRLDASKMYHSIRGQAAIKLYVIYNVLEVCDRLFSALGQDVLECLFSRETLDRNSAGRSKVIRPFWMFVLALVYNVVHATALFYQVITLNVAVNSYSNALLTLLMSNQFVEIKSTVFKKFEKENLFQLTCADVVERFQLWLMLLIIAMRNVVEVGGLTIRSGDTSSSSSSFMPGNSSLPLRTTSIIPKAFTIFPKWTGQVLGPFLLVLGSEMLIDWLKHAYITKFNITKPALYGRFLDVLAKDYYSNAFADQNLTKRLGLPVLPLACLFIRAVIQTYHMFIATHMPPPLPSTATALSSESASTTSPATTAALVHIDQLFRRAMGRSSFAADANTTSFNWWSFDDVIAFATMILVFLLGYLVLLAVKLVLGMCLLSFARSRYRGMKERETMSVDTGGKRIGGWGVVEVGEDKRRWIYDDDPEGLKTLKNREARNKEKDAKGMGDLMGVSRYAMVAKRIW